MSKWSSLSTVTQRTLGWHLTGPSFFHLWNAQTCNVSARALKPGYLQMFRKSWRLFIPNLALCTSTDSRSRYRIETMPTVPEKPQHNATRPQLESFPELFLGFSTQDKGLLHATARKAQRTNPESITSRVFHIPATPQLIISVAPTLNMSCWEVLVLHLSIQVSESIQARKNGGSRYIWPCESK